MAIFMDFSSIDYVVLVVATVAFLSLSSRRMASHPRLPPRAQGSVPIVGSTGFWTDFRSWHRNQQSYLAEFHRLYPDVKNPFNAISFNLMHMPVVGIAGASARKEFFTNPSFSLAKGVALVIGTLVPRGNSKGTRNAAKTKKSDVDDFDGNMDLDAKVVARLKAMVSVDKIKKCVPVLISDVSSFVESLPHLGRFDVVHEDIHDLLQLLIIRLIGFKELENVSARHSFTMDAEVIFRPSTAMGILLPWCPFVPSVFSKFRAAKNLYQFFRKAVREREQSGPREDDPLQPFMDSNAGWVQIFTVFVSAVGSGSSTVSQVAGYTLIYLALHPDWRSKVLKEVEEVAAAHVQPQPGFALLDRLKQVPLEGFESMVLVNACIREALRMTMAGPMCRYNTGSDIEIGDFSIPSQSWVTYPIEEVHNDPSFFPEPDVYNPEHFVPGNKNEHNQNFQFIGWGAGKHPCPGMRFATLEITLLVTFLIVAYDLDLIRTSPSSDVAATTPLKPAEYARPRVSVINDRRDLRDSVKVRFRKRAEVV